MIVIFDAAGTPLHSEPAKEYKHFNRLVMANQPRLDALAKSYPQAVRAKIGIYSFHLFDGASQFVGDYGGR